MKILRTYARGVLPLLLAAVTLLTPLPVPAAAATNAVVLEVASTGKGSIDRELTRRSLEALKKRVATLGISGATVEPAGERRLLVRFSGESAATGDLVRRLLRTVRLEFRMVDDGATPDSVPSGEEVLYEATMRGEAREIEEIPYVVGRKPLLTGDIVKRATAAIDPYTNEPVVSIELTPTGASAFAALTESAIGRRLAVVLNGHVISAPVIRERIEGGRLQVSGAFTRDEADDVVAALNSPLLPAPLRVVASNGESPLAAPATVPDVDRPPAARAGSHPHDFAVVIGIEKYRDIGGVEFAEHDATAVRSYLVNLLGYPAENVVLLPNERATRSDLEKYLGRWLANRVDRDSAVFVYFAGHGAPNPASGEPYLVPYDGDPNYLETTGYSLRELYASLAKLPAREIFVVLDSCFSGSGGRSVIAAGARPLVMTTATRVSVPANTVVFAAAGGNQISTSYPREKHGLFTYFLLKGLRGEADADGDGTITVRELYSFVRSSVEREARLENVEQTPVLLPQRTDAGKWTILRLR